MLTDPTNQDNLEKNGEQYRNFSEAQDALKILGVVINSMARKNEGSTQQLDRDSIQIEIDIDDFAWHCYLCGHTWVPHDRTNADPSEGKCPSCDRYEFNKTIFLCRHDANCPRCLKKKRKMLKMLEKLQES